MGVVYLAEDGLLGRQVALKTLPSTQKSQALRDRLIREARVCAKLDHPGVIRLHDIGHDQGVDFLVMEYVTGRTLAAFLQESPTTPPMTQRDAAVMFAEILEGMEHAHGLGIVHRDLKPANIMVTREGRTKIMDFGLAWQQEQAQLTRDGAVMGTLAYFSPEQARGEKADERSDIYSLGAIFFEMLTGHLVFEANTPAAMIFSHLQAPPPSLREHLADPAPELDLLIQKCLQKDAADRYASARPMRQELDAFLRGGSDARPAAWSGAACSPPGTAVPTGGTPPPFPVPGAGMPTPAYPPPRAASPPPFSMPASGSGFAPPRALQGTPCPQAPGAGAGAPPARPCGFGFPPTPALGGAAGGPYASPMGTAGAPAPQGGFPAGLPLQARGTPPGFPAPPPLGSTPPTSLAALLARSAPDEAGSRRDPMRETNLLGADRLRQSACAPGMGPGFGDAPGRRDPMRETNLLGAEHLRPSSSRSEVGQGPDDPVARGVAAYRKGDKEQARAELTAGLAAQPDSFEANLFLGRLELDEQTLQAAEMHLLAARRLNPRDPRALNDLARLYQEQGHPEQAAEACRQSLGLAPENPGTRCRLASLLAESGRTAEALAEYDRALQGNPAYAPAWRAVARLHASQDRLSEAARAYKMLTRAEPQDEDALRNLTSLRLRLRDYAGAERACRKALALAPGEASLYLDLATALEAQARPDQALQALEKATDLDPTQQAAQERLAAACMRGRHPKQARATLEQGLRHCPQSSRLHLLLADLCAMEGQAEQACDLLEKGLVLHPVLGATERSLGTVEVPCGLDLAWCRDEVDMNPQDASKRMLLALAEYRMDRVRAAQEMQRASGLDPGNVDCYRLLSLMWEAAGRPDEAQQVLTRALVLLPRNPVLPCVLSRMWLQQGQSGQAATLLKRALDANPADAMLHFYLGRTRRATGQPERAVRSFRRCLESLRRQSGEL